MLIIHYFPVNVFVLSISGYVYASDEAKLQLYEILTVLGIWLTNTEAFMTLN